VKKREKPKANPAHPAATGPIPRDRTKKNAPAAARKSLSAAASADAHDSGRARWKSVIGVTACAWGFAHRGVPQPFAAKRSGRWPLR
jgi:hypothetical protein